MKKRHLLGAVLIIFVFWWLVSIIISKPILPTPITIILHGFVMLDKLFIHILYSFIRIILGILIGVCLGWPLGILAGYYKNVDNFLSPIIYLLYPIPKIALLPILMLLFGLGESTKIIVIVIIILFQIIVTVRDGIKEIDDKIFYPLAILGSTQTQNIRHIVIPATLPKLFSAIRISLGTAIAVLFFSETFGTTYGLGYFIMDSLIRINYPDMYVGIMVLSTLGLTLFFIIDFIHTKLVKWQ
ncbi:MAG: ABC transporter permease [Eubacteriales bacterium]